MTKNGGQPLGGGGGDVVVRGKKRERCFTRGNIGRGTVVRGKSLIE